MDLQHCIRWLHLESTHLDASRVRCGVADAALVLVAYHADVTGLAPTGRKQRIHERISIDGILHSTSIQHTYSTRSTHYSTTHITTMAHTRKQPRSS
jgi:hypothetical protein